MDTQVSTIVAPRDRKSSRYESEDVILSPPHINDSYHKSSQQRKERCSTYDKIVQEMSEVEDNSFGTKILSILGGGDTNVFCHSTGPGINTAVGGTITINSSGGIHFNKKPSLKQDLPYASLLLPSEYKDTSTSEPSPGVKSLPHLLDFVEKFNKEEDENLCPDDFLEYRGSQSIELSIEPGGTVIYQNNQVNFETSHESENSIYDMNSNCLETQCNKAAHSHTVDNKQKMFRNTLTQLVDPLSTITLPVSNNPEIPEPVFKDNVLKIPILSIANTPNTLDLITKVRRFSHSSISNSTNSVDLSDKEHKPLSHTFSLPSNVSFQESESITVSDPSIDNTNTLGLITKVRRFSHSSISNSTNSVDLSVKEHKPLSHTFSLPNNVSFQESESIATSIDPLSTITSVSNTSEIPEPVFKENVLKLPISFVANTPNTLDLITKVRRLSLSSISNSTNSENQSDKEHKSLAHTVSVSNNVIFQESESISTSISYIPIPPTKERRYSDSFLGFVNGIFSRSPSQSLPEKNNNVKEVAEISMIFRC